MPDTPPYLSPDAGNLSVSAPTVNVPYLDSSSQNPPVSPWASPVTAQAYLATLTPQSPGQDQTQPDTPAPAPQQLPPATFSNGVPIPSWNDYKAQTGYDGTDYQNQLRLWNQYRTWIPYVAQHYGDDPDLITQSFDQSVPKPQQPTRTFLQAANDTVVSAADPIIGAAKAIVDTVAPGSAPSRWLGGLLAESYYSPEMQDEHKRLQREEAQNPHSIVPYLEYAARNPLQTAAGLAGTIAPFVATDGLAEAGAAAAGISDAANLARLGIGANALVGGAMGAGGVRGAVYDTINAMPDAQLRQQSPQYNALRNQGVSEADAKNTVGTVFAQNLPEILASGALGAAAGYFGPLQRTIAGVASSGGKLANMGIQAALMGGQMGGSQIADNMAIRNAIPSTPVMQGVPQAVAQGALYGAIGGMGARGADEAPAGAPADSEAVPEATPPNEAATAGMPAPETPPLPPSPDMPDASGAMMVDQTGAIRPETYQEAADARMQAQNATDTGLTPDVRAAQPAQAETPETPQIPETETTQTEVPETETPAAILQNRDRSTAASIAQVNSIAANPDPARLGFSRDFATGAPIVEANPSLDIPPSQLGTTDYAVTSDGQRIPVQYAVVDADSLLPSNNATGTPNADYATGTPDQLRVIAGNGRVAGVQEAYQRGTALNYRTGIASDPQLTGISQVSTEGVRNPVLVRVMPRSAVTPDIGDVSNTTGVAAMSPVEQARNDVNRVDLDTLDFNADGSPTADAVRAFVHAMPVSEQTGMLNTDGSPTRQAVDRLMSATFQRAYGDPELVRLYAQTTDPDARTVLGAMASAAGSMSKLEGAGDLDIRPLVTDAAKIAVNASRQGVKLATLANQHDLAASPASNVFVRLFANNIRSGKRIGEALRNLADLSYTEASKDDADMFGAVPRLTRAQLLERVNNDTARSQDMGVPVGGESAQQDALRQATERSEQPDNRPAQEVGATRPGEAGGERAAGPPANEPGQTADRAAGTVTVTGENLRESENGIQRPNANRTDTLRAPQEQFSGGNRGASPGEIEQRGTRNAQGRSAVVAQGIQPSGAFATETGSRTVATVRSGSDRLTTPELVAHALAPLRRRAQENTVALVTDAQGKPLEIIRHQLGDTASVEINRGIMVGSTLRVPGGAHVWLVHNHPAGEARLSQEDRNVSNVMQDMYRGTHLQYEGQMAIAGNKFAYVGPHGDISERIIPPMVRRHAINVTERTFRRQGALAQPAQRTPASVLAAARTASGARGGVAFLDARGNTVGFVPLSVSEMARLRDTGAAERLFAGIDRSNSITAVVQLPDTKWATFRAALNTARLLRRSSQYHVTGVDPAGHEVPLDANPNDIYLSRPAPDANEPLLHNPTPEELRAREEQNRAAQAENARAQRDADNRAAADEEARNFTLTGSDRPADVAAAHGQGVLFQRAWHGSPARGIEQDRFGLDHVGEGEGAQAYGHGIYFAGARGVAEGYRLKLGKPNPGVIFPNGDNVRWTYNGEVFRPEEGEGQLEGSEEVAAHVVTMGNTPAFKSDVERAEKDGDESVSYASQNGGSVEIPLSQAREALKMIEDGNIEDKSTIGQLYSAEIPDDSELLDWDKRLDKQPKGVLDKLYREINSGDEYDDEAQPLDTLQNMLFGNSSRYTGEDLYVALTKDFGSKREAGEYLNYLGIPGLRYLDGTSRRAGEGTHNYVIWDENRLGDDIRAYYQRHGINPGEAPQNEGLSASGGMTGDDVRAALKDDALFNHQNVDVYDTNNDVPAHIHEQLMRNGVTNAEGFFDPATGRVGLIARNIRDAQRAREIARHELVGHYGLARMLGTDAMDELVRKVQAGERLGNKAITEIGREVDIRQPGLDPDRRASEIIALMAEKNLHNSIVRRVINGVRQWLTKLGVLHGDTTDADIADLLRDTEDHLREQGRDSMAMPRASDMGMVYSRRDSAVQFGQRRGLFDLPDIPVTRLTGTELGNPDGGKAFMRANARNKLREFAKASAAERTNPDTGWELTVTGDDAKKMSLDSKRTIPELQSVAGIQDMVKNAVLAETHPDTTHHNPDVQAVHHLVTPVEINGTPYRANMTVRDYAGGKVPNRRSLRVIDTVELEKADGVRNGSDVAEGRSQPSVSDTARNPESATRTGNWTSGNDTNSSDGLSPRASGVPGSNGQPSDVDTASDTSPDSRSAPTASSNNTMSVADLMRNARREGDGQPFRPDESNPVQFSRPRPASARSIPLVEQEPTLTERIKSLAREFRTPKSAARQTAKAMLMEGGKEVQPQWLENAVTKMFDYRNPVINLVRKTIAGNKGNEQWGNNLINTMRTFEAAGEHTLQDFSNGRLKDMETAIQGLWQKYRKQAWYQEHGRKQFLNDLGTIGGLVKHGPERNAEIARKTQGQDMAGSGRTNEEIAQIEADIRQAAPGLIEDYEKLYQDHVRPMLDYRDQVLRQAGLLTPEMEAARPQYQWYVPMQGDPATTDEGFEAGGSHGANGRSLKAPKDKQAMGRNGTLSDNPILNAVIGVNDAVRRAGTQEFKRAIVDFVKNTKGAKALMGARINEPPDNEIMEKYVGSDGYVHQRVKAGAGLSPDAIVLRDGNKVTTLEIRNQPVLDALRATNTNANDGIWAIPMKATRFLAAAFTRYNPTFPLTVKLKDLQQQYSYALGDAPVANRWAVIRHALANNLTFTKMMAQDKRGNLTQYGQWLRRYEGLGGHTVYTDLFHDDVMANLEKHFNSIGDDTPLARAKQYAAGFNQFLDAVHSHMEMTNRVAMFKALVEAGVPEHDAVTYTKGLLNYEVKGTYGRQFGALYAFSNVALHDARRLAQTLRTPGGATVMLAHLALMYALYGAAKSMSGDDPDGIPRLDKVPLSQTGRFLTLLDPNDPDGRGWKFPVGFGMGRMSLTLAAAFHRMMDGVDDKGDFVNNVLNNALATNFSPIEPTDVKMSKGFFPWLVQQFAPTTILPIAQLAMNQNGQGSPIHAPDNDESKLAFTQGKPMTPQVFQDAAKLIYDNTGMDIFPETIRFLLQNYLGVVPMESVRAVQLMGGQAGNDIGLADVPLAQTFASKTYNEDTVKFWNSFDDLKRLQGERNYAQQQGTLDEFDARYPDLQEGIKVLQSARGQLSQIRKQINQARSIADPADRREALLGFARQQRAIEMRANQVLRQIESGSQ